MRQRNPKKIILRESKKKTLAILMEEYIATLFRLVTSDRDKETVINCMEMIGRVYETGITNLMKKET